MAGPLFVCHANCCRSVLACYLYRHLCDNAPACSAGMDAGEQINDRAERLLREWGIDASGHHPSTVSRDACLQADAIFVMAPSYLHRLLWEYGEDLASKAYLFADPSFDNVPTSGLVQEFGWMRDRVLQIHATLLGKGRRLVPASEYLDLCRSVDRGSH